MLMSRPPVSAAAVGDRAFLAFKLHQFFSGAGTSDATLREPGQRQVTLDGQLFRSRRYRSSALSHLLLPELRPGAPPRRSDRSAEVRASHFRAYRRTPLDDEDRAEQAGLFDAGAAAATPNTRSTVPWSITRRTGLRPARAAHRLGATGAICRQQLIVDANGTVGMTWTPGMVFSRQVPVLPGMQGPAASRRPAKSTSWRACPQRAAVRQRHCWSQARCDG